MSERPRATSAPVNRDIGEIINPRLRRLYAYWCERRGDRRFPARADIDALDLTFLRGNLILVDVVPGEPPHFHIRLHGTNLVQRVGYELTGRRLNELPDNEFRQQARQTFRWVVENGQPFRGYRDRMLDGQPHHYETVVLPLSDDGEQVDRLLVGLIYAGEREPS
jgi:hypothetical protein